MKLSKMLYLVSFFLNAVICLIIGLYPMMATAADVTLAWDPNTEEDLAGYKVYYSTSSGPPFPTVVDVGNVTQFTVTGLYDETTYYFVATALDTFGCESGYSNVVSINFPTLSHRNPTFHQRPHDGSEKLNDFSLHIPIAESEQDCVPSKFYVSSSCRGSFLLSETSSSTTNANRTNLPFLTDPSFLISLLHNIFGRNAFAQKKESTPPDPPTGLHIVQARFPVERALSSIIQEKLDNLDLGKILFNPPKQMKVGLKERIEVRITRKVTEDFTEGLRGRGVLQIEEIKVGTFMKVRLMGDSFKIKSLSHEEQLVQTEGYTQWEWDVLPLKGGLQSLMLAVTVRIKIPNFGEELKDYPVLEKEIEVKVNPLYSFKGFFRNYWQWIFTAILFPIIVWIVKKLYDRMGSNKKQLPKE